MHHGSRDQNIEFYSPPFRPAVSAQASKHYLILYHLGRQRRRLSLYIKMAPLCENGRGLRTHQSCDLGFAGPAGQGRGGLIFEPPRERRFKDQTSEGALLRPFFGPV